MMNVLPFDEIGGEQLNPEQRSYLEGVFAGLRNRGVTFAEAAPAAQPIPRGDENLIFEERVKRELHPLDAYPVLLEHAHLNKAPDKESLFRFKWHGLFYLTPNKEAFMTRLRIPGGILKSFQLRELANVARDLTSGYVQITTRANLQMRLIKPKDAPAVLSRIQGVGLHTRGAGADNIRNITANPTAGIDPHELIDTLPYCRELAQIIINDRAFYDLPRKFNIAFDGGGLIGSVEDTNDIGIKAVEVKNGNSEIKGGIYFRIALGGATGHRTFASDLGVLVAPDQILKVTAAIVKVFIDNGDRTNRKRARLKHLLEKWTLQQYLEAVEKKLGFKLIRDPLDEKGKSAIIKERTLPKVPHSHVGVFPQRQKGLNYIGVAIPVGQISPQQMIRIADLADHYGSGEVRLTVWENLIIPNIPDAFVETVKKSVVKMGFDWKQSHLRSGLIACTGNAYCKFAAANTKKHALELASYLERRLQLDQPLNIHLTGCPNSCAQHYMGDIGLLGAQVKVSGETVEGYHVFVGGGFGENQSIGRQVFQGVSVEQLKPTLERMLKAYLQHRINDESFQQFTKRHDLNQLQVLFSQES